MTRRNIAQVLAALVFIASQLAATDLNGKWTGNITVPDHTIKVLLKLKVSGQEVSGTFGPTEDQLSTIENGRVEGNKLTFQFTGPGGAKFRFELTLDGDSLKGSFVRSIGGNSENGTADLKRTGS